MGDMTTHNRGGGWRGRPRCLQVGAGDNSNRPVREGAEFDEDAGLTSALVTFVAGQVQVVGLWMLI